jgi:F-type H+-transporting ATPase subunit b
MEFNATFLVSAVSFVLFTLIMNKIFYKPLANIMNERETFIHDNLVDANISNNKADEITQDKEKRLAQSMIDAKSIVAKELAKANENSRTITDNAKIKSKEDIKSAKNLLQKEAQDTENELNSKINELADIITSRVLEQS